MAVKYTLEEELNGGSSYFESIILDIKLKDPISDEDKTAIRDVMDKLEKIADNYRKNKEAE